VDQATCIESKSLRVSGPPLCRWPQLELIIQN
jgi:hypothetical protein